MFKNYFRSKDNLKSIFFIAFYILIFYVLAKEVLSPITRNIVLAIYDVDLKTLQDYAKGDLITSTPEFYDNIIYRLDTIFQLVIYSILTIGITVPSFKSIKSELSLSRNDTQSLSKNIVSGFIIFYLCSFAGNIITLVLQKAGISTGSANQSFLVSLINSSNINLIIMIITAGILGPIVEELIYRKSIFSLIKNDYVALAISSIIFGLIHALSTNGSVLVKLCVSIPYVFSGLGFGLIYKKSDKNICVPIVIHMFSNLLSIVMITTMPQNTPNFFIFF